MVRVKRVRRDEGPRASYAAINRSQPAIEERRMKKEMPGPETMFLERRDWIPINPSLPVLIYWQVLVHRTDLAARFEALFDRNGWPARWRDGIYDYHHYHSTAHEVLGIACGSATLALGGLGGADVEVRVGDVLILPAGTGHRRIASSADFLVVGAYPPEQDFDICREAPTDDMLGRIAHLPFPQSDPVEGEGGSLPLIWGDARNARADPR